MGRWANNPIYSEPRQPQAQRTVDKQWRKQSDQDLKAFHQLCRTAFACEADAQQALQAFEPGLQVTQGAQSRSVPSRLMASGGDQDPAPYPRR